MLLPQNVAIDGVSGAVAPETGRYEKRLSALEGIFHDEAACCELCAAADPLIYTVIEYRKDGSDLFFGTTIIEAGRIGGEYFMTRGHYHQRDDMGEVYYTQSGKGVLLLQSRAGETRELEMIAGTVCFIPPGWAHRSINTGGEKLVFVWVCNPLAGNDYDEIRHYGMRKLVMQQGEDVAIVDNPRFEGP